MEGKNTKIFVIFGEEFEISLVWRFTMIWGETVIALSPQFTLKCSWPFHPDLW
jgi:hypothetical protein